MLAVRARMAETFTTFFAHERFLAGMETFVFGQVMLVFECLATDVTGEGPRSGMFVFVSGEGTLLAEHLLTLVTGVHALTFIDLVMLPRSALLAVGAVLIHQTVEEVRRVLAVVHSHQFLS